MPEDNQIYATCMATLRNRLNVVDDVLTGRIAIPVQHVMAEIIFVQFRKCLEELAFASLSANKDVYSAVHANFSVHWKADKMLTELEKVNPSFYPIAAQPPKKVSTGQRHFDRLENGFLTRQDFADLYGHSSNVLHTRNPYKGSDDTIRIGYTVQEWVQRFRNLLRWHIATLVNGNVILCHVPDQGDVQVYAAMAS